MLPDATLPVPASLMTLLTGFAPLFTAPLFRTFTMLACGFLAQSGKRTVCGMLAGAGVARLWPHDRAHWFFSRARWDPDELGLTAARLVVALLVPAGEPVTVAIDDTLFRRRRGKRSGRGSTTGPRRASIRPDAAITGYGDGQRVFLRVRPRLLVRRPRSWHRLAGDLEVVHQLGPGPDGGALARLWRVLDQLVQTWVAATVPAGLDPHASS